MLCILRGHPLSKKRQLRRPSTGQHDVGMEAHFGPSLEANHRRFRLRHWQPWQVKNSFGKVRRKYRTTQLAYRENRVI